MNIVLLTGVVKTIRSTPLYTAVLIETNEPTPQCVMVRSVGAVAFPCGASVEVQGRLADEAIELQEGRLTNESGVELRHAVIYAQAILETKETATPAPTIRRAPPPPRPLARVPASPLQQPTEKEVKDYASGPKCPWD